MKRAIITGGAGFLGSHLADKLISEGYFVIAIDNLYTGSEKNIAHLEGSESFKFVNADIREKIEVDGDIDEIYNLACPASPPHYQRAPIFTLDTNYLGMKNVLTLAKEKNARVLQASTSEIYGDPLEHPQKESYKGNVNTFGIRSCYDEGKRITETLCLEYNRAFGVEIKVIRIFNTYGPRMDAFDGRVVSNFITQAIKGEKITIYGDGSQTRAFCFVSDLIEGIYRMMTYDKDFVGPINLGNTGEFSVKELAEIIIEYTKSPSQIEYLPLPSDDPTRRRPDISLAKEKLNWEPKVSLREGVAKTVDYFKSIN